MDELLTIFKALSEGTRLRVLKLLQHGELCVCDIVAALSTSQPKISFHLNVLKEAGLIKDRKQGRWIHYRLEESDTFRRSLVLSLLEKLSDKDAEDDRKRLVLFLKTKGSKPFRCKYGGKEMETCQG